MFLCPFCLICASTAKQFDYNNMQNLEIEIIEIISLIPYFNTFPSLF